MGRSTLSKAGRYIARPMAMILALVVVGAGVESCGKKKRSQRDTRRDQIRANAESKRQELRPVAGDYRGYITQESEMLQDVILHLEVKDIPESEEGEIDPVLVPRLTGYLRFQYGGEANYVGFGIEEADFDAETQKLNLKVFNEEYKNLLLDLKRKGKEQELLGTWAAPHISSAGEVRLFRNSSESGDPNLTGLDHQIHGSYQGIVQWTDKQKYQLVDLAIKMNPNPPEGVSISADVKLYRGDRGKEEFLAYHFGTCLFNPISGELSLKNEGGDVSFVGKFSDGQLAGAWTSRFLGEVGPFTVSKVGTVSAPSSLTQLSPLEGTYQGTLTTTHPSANLPERFQVGLVTAEVQGQPGNIHTSGGMRLYLGDFGSTEYIEIGFASVEFNYYTHIFSAKSADEDYPFTLKGSLSDRTLKGTMLHESMGSVGEFEVVQR